MYQSNSRRKLFPVDMFPLINLSIIVLMFLLQFGRPRMQCPIDINLPIGHYFNTRDLEGDQITILEGQGKVMLRLETEDVRKEALIMMGNIYHLSFTPSELLKFGKIDIIGSPMSEMKRYIANHYNPTEYYAQKGIPVAANGELYNWIMCLRMATLKVQNHPAHLNIQADKETSYTVIKNIIHLLNKQRIYKFSIIYSFVWQR